MRLDKEKFNEYLEKHGEVGFVEMVAYPIVKVKGLPTAKPSEVILFESGEIGEVTFISPEYVNVLTFSEKPVELGVRASKTETFLEVPVGDSLLGKTIDPLGRSLYKSKPSGIFSEYRPIEILPVGIGGRKKITKTLETGVAVVDLMVPLGKGQRELVIGDRKTGKTNFLLQTVLTQSKKGTVCIYAMIGKRKTDILSVEKFLKENGIRDKTVVVASSSIDSAGVIHLTPYSAMTLAEYFKDQGRDVLIILDDLSTHAKFYREISLLSKNFPGRNSYPGDIFYTHARLIERAGNFKFAGGGSDGDGNDKEVSITCLPVAETVEGDISGYIQTNLMSMTDGHIYFDKDLFTEGRRPAVNFFLSVTRVGRQTQTPVRSGLNRELNSFLTLHNKTQTFIHFGAELSEGAKTTLAMGERILSFFNQSAERTLDMNLQIMLFCLIWIGTWNKVSVEQTQKEVGRIILGYEKNERVKKLFQDYISEAKDFNGMLGRVSADSGKILEVLSDELSTKLVTPEAGKK